jgi:hypothetical protein
MASVGGLLATDRVFGLLGVGGGQIYGELGFGPVVLVHTQKVGIKYKKPLSLTSKKIDLWQSSQTIIRRFDSSHLSQSLLPLAWLTKRPEKGKSRLFAHSVRRS